MSNTISSTIVEKTLTLKCDSIMCDVADLIEKCEVLESQLFAADQVYDAVMEDGGVLTDEQIEHATERARRLRRIGVAVKGIRWSSDRAASKAVFVLGRNGES